MTGRIIPLQGDRHREIQLLLPWYLAGGLDEADHAVVAGHLADCLECQAELKLERGLAAEARATDDGYPYDVEHGWAAMRGLIAEGPQRRRGQAGALAWAKGLGRGAAEAWRAGPPLLRWAVAAQACLLVAVALVAWQMGRPAAYQALSAPAAAERSANIVVIFRPETTEGRMREILRASQARLVDGPTAANAYLLHAPARTEALAALKGRPEVDLAEPIDSGPPS